MRGLKVEAIAQITHEKRLRALEVEHQGGHRGCEQPWHAQHTHRARGCSLVHLRCTSPLHISAAARARGAPSAGARRKRQARIHEWAPVVSERGLGAVQAQLCAIGCSVSTAPPQHILTCLRYEGFGAQRGAHSLACWFPFSRAGLGRHGLGAACACWGECGAGQGSQRKPSG